MDHCIVTHSGYFHADEVTACAILGLIERWSKLPNSLIRTRDPDIIENAHRKAYILDVGQVYNPDNYRFDHHQSSFDSYFCTKAQELGVKMSSCGLIFRAYGDELLKTFDIDTDLLEEFYLRYILEIDANDNGVSEFVKPPEQRFKTSYSLPSIIGSCNGVLVEDNGPLAKEQDRRFLKAVGLAKKILVTFLKRFKEQKDDEARTKAIIDSAVPINYGDHYVVWILPEKCDYYRGLWARMKEDVPSKRRWVFTVSPRDAVAVDPPSPSETSASLPSVASLRPADVGRWQIHTVNLPGEKFKHYADILSSDEARAVIGQDLVFVHNNKFIAITKTKESALLLAEASVRKITEADEKRKEYYDRLLAVVLVELLVLLFVALDQGFSGFVLIIPAQIPIIMMLMGRW